MNRKCISCILISKKRYCYVCACVSSRRIYFYESECLFIETACVYVYIYIYILYIYELNVYTNFDI